MSNDSNDSDNSPTLPSVADELLAYLTPEERAEFDHLLSAPPLPAEVIETLPTSAIESMLAAWPESAGGDDAVNLATLPLYAPLKVSILDALTVGYWRGEQEPLLMPEEEHASLSAWFRQHFDELRERPEDAGGLARLYSLRWAIEKGPTSADAAEAAEVVRTLRGRFGTAVRISPKLPRTS